MLCIASQSNFGTWVAYYDVTIMCENRGGEMGDIGNHPH